MNELHFAYRVRQLLNHGLRDLKPETLNRLAEAREKALLHQKQSVNQSVLASAGRFFQHHVSNMGVKQLLISLALLLSVVSTAFWVADQRVSELSAIDSALLANDLPIGAFTDRGFDAWLKRGS